MNLRIFVIATHTLHLYKSAYSVIKVAYCLDLQYDNNTVHRTNSLNDGVCSYFMINQKFDVYQSTEGTLLGGCTTKPIMTIDADAE